MRSNGGLTVKAFTNGVTVDITIGEIDGGKGLLHFVNGGAMLFEDVKRDDISSSEFVESAYIIVGDEVDGCWLCWESRDLLFTAKACENALVDRRWADEVEARFTKLLTLKDLALVNKLWNNSLGDILPVEAYGVIDEGAAFLQCGLRITVFACCIDCLDFNCRKIDQVSFAI